MPNLLTLQGVKAAHHQADFNRIIVHLLFSSTTYIQIVLWFIILVFFSSVAILFIHNETRPTSFFVITVMIALFFAISCHYSIRATYKPYYDNYGYLIKRYGKNMQFLRFLIFRDNLHRNGISVDSALGVRYLLLLDDNSASRGFFSDKLTRAIIYLFTAILGGSASMLEGWTIGLMPGIIFLIIIMFLFHYIFYQLFESAAYREHELARFLQWLEADKNNKRIPTLN